jgi:transposase
VSDSKRPVEGELRLETACREQLELVPTSIDDLIAADPPARAIWDIVGKLDLSKFAEACRSRGENAGRPAIDPRILVTLRLFATSQGVGSSRELSRLTKEHAAYRWICGRVDVSYHTLSDFRVGHGEALDALLTEVLAVLMHQDLLTLERTAQDGRRLPAGLQRPAHDRHEIPRHRLRPLATLQSRDLTGSLMGRRSFQERVKKSSALTPP